MQIGQKTISRSAWTECGWTPKKQSVPASSATARVNRAVAASPSLPFRRRRASAPSATIPHRYAGTIAIVRNPKWDRSWLNHEARDILNGSRNSRPASPARPARSVSSPGANRLSVSAPGSRLTPRGFPIRPQFQT